MSSSLVVMGWLGAAVQAEPAPAPDVTGAPLPGDESGQIRDGERARRPSAGRVLARGALFIPRVIVEVVLLPMEGLIWFYDRYDLGDLYFRTFYNEARTFGVIPTLVYQTGFGLMLGVRLVETDLFGELERVSVNAAYGGSYQVRTQAWLDSGLRLDPVVLSVGGNFDRFGRLPFYGIGNADRSARPQMLVDPRVDDTAFETHYRYQELRAAVVVDWRMSDGLHLRGTGALTDLSFGSPTSGTQIDDVYDPAGLVGFDEDVTHVYGELELRLDRRRIAEPRWETTAYTTGWLARGYVGGVHLFDDRGDFAHYGVDLQAFLHLALGPRMLVLRLRGEGVTGGIDEVPFSELPYLGGDLLRGYDFARFRDRVSALGTAQYVWDLSRHLNAFLFADAGRVYRSFEDLSFDDLRVGFGGGLEVHTNQGFVIAGTLASSRDGGIFVTATLNPLWDEVARWR